jgi:hypothetical protein
LKENLDLIPKIEASIASLSTRPLYMSLKDIASRSPNLTSKVGKFVMSVADQLNYPRFTGVVKNLKQFVHNNRSVMNALLEYSGYSESEINNNLEFNSGPTIIIKDLKGGYGEFDSDTPNNVIVGSAWVLGLEQANLLSTQQATSFLLGVTTLHEYVHQARFVNGLPKGDGITVEYGWWFEYRAFGVYITAKNASQFTIKMFPK